jgi:hypothetical protein
LRKASAEADPDMVKFFNDNTPPQWKPPYLYPSNNKLPRSLLLTEEEFVKTKDSNAVLKSFSIMNYRQFTRAFSDFGINFEISPERVVAVTVVEFPKVLDASNVNYCNAKVVTYRDAETRHVFGYAISGKKRFSKGPDVDSANKSTRNLKC